MAYELLREAAHKRTEYLVIEAGVDTESTAKSLLPLELVSLLRQSLDIIDVEEDLSSVCLNTVGGVVTHPRPFWP
jgi:E3 ubiquitin-protein ligase listerin